MPEMTAIIIAGLTMWVTELFKRFGTPKFYVPVIAFTVAGALTVGWYQVFDPAFPWQEALKNGFVLGATAGGLYGYGQVVMRKPAEVEAADEKVGGSE